MKAVHLYNSLGLAFAMVTSLVAANVSAPKQQRQAPKFVDAATTAPVVVDGKRGLRDASGRFVPIADYQRIVSLSSVADSLLHALVAPPRIAAYSPYAATSHHAYRYEGKPTLPMAYSMEALISLAPDLIIANHLSSPDQMAQLRDSGLLVFDLGEMKGLGTLLPNIRSLATLLSVPERGAILARDIAARMQSIHRDAASTPRPSAIYAGIHGDKTYGGGRGTSYHDVLVAAGLHDIAADHYQGWPRYTPEQLLQLDPEILVTQRDMGEVLCRQPGLSALRVCGHGGRIIEMDSSLLLSPGLDMVDAAQELYFRVQAGR